MSEDKLLSHDYDGIQELDNDLPRWWLWMFIISIVWAVLYVFYYHVASIGYLSADEYKLEMDPSYVRVNSADTKLLGIAPEYHSPLFNPYGDVTPYSKAMGIETEAFVRVTRETDTLEYVALTDAEDISQGHEIFVKKCSNCHGVNGEGGVGPNLTDDYWLHGSSMTDITKTILYGFPAKGMISWRGFLTDKQILQAASHILTLRGTNPPNAKAPQGELVTD